MYNFLRIICYVPLWWIAVLPSGSFSLCRLSYAIVIAFPVACWAGSRSPGASATILTHPTSTPSPPPRPSQRPTPTLLPLLRGGRCAMVVRGCCGFLIRWWAGPSLLKATNQYHHTAIYTLHGTTPAKVETSFHLTTLVQHYLYSLIDVLLTLVWLCLQIFARLVKGLHCLSLWLDFAQQGCSFFLEDVDQFSKD
jgi:hypothetical protein